MKLAVRMRSELNETEARTGLDAEHTGFSTRNKCVCLCVFSSPPLECLALPSAPGTLVGGFVEGATGPGGRGEEGDAGAGGVQAAAAGGRPPRGGTGQIPAPPPTSLGSRAFA